ncbi:hypothetical protein [Micromonospora sp. HM5-17]|jgi:hypothetical protein|uniref:hypothetical protein n=1 Tax=Micromonospora sp. HM5-17 TaxID=2487710 RepID=UPI000F493531|nr:hypothetical protein [Micromonospora sp. HM5-17]ROT33426.1 hypothetical protein EF879_00035 [Micromonospora sp. HM5-17]
MRTDLEVAWYWDWVPAAGSDAAERSAWAGSVAERLDAWVGDKVAAARAAWPADAAEEFPFSTGEMGAAVARDLLERADSLPRNCRLIWGAGFLGDEARWLPLLVLAEFREARPGDSAYLMDLVGAEGFPDDVREPHVEYVTTDHGDGVWVLALAQSEGEGLHGRVTAALRLEAPTGDVDVLLTTRVTGVDQLAVIGPGVEAVMHMIANQFGAEPGGDLAPLRFVPAARQES